MGLFVEPAIANNEALRVLGDPDETISIVISDINRDVGPNGLDLLRSINGLPNRPPVIFYVTELDPERGTPPTSFGITNRPDQLLNLVMDALDRGSPARD